MALRNAVDRGLADTEALADLVSDVDLAKLAMGQVSPTEEQETMIGLIDGRRDVTALMDESVIGEFAVGKAPHGLAQAPADLGQHRGGCHRRMLGEVEDHDRLVTAMYEGEAVDPVQMAAE